VGRFGWLMFMPDGGDAATIWNPNGNYSNFKYIIEMNG
jgi:hypothetical protein